MNRAVLDLIKKFKIEVLLEWSSQRHLEGAEPADLAFAPPLRERALTTGEARACPPGQASCCWGFVLEKRLRIARAGFSTNSHDTYPANQDAGTAANISQ